ncbi:KGK domain-containing protein [Nostoc sp.]|uniref:KGK domain-containing protein n=1 Tax=Nostoc sp. TaxID=1180 RepID=UPI002FF53F26
MSIEKFGLDPGGKLGLTNDDVIALTSADYGLEKMTKLGQLIQAIEQWSNKNSNNKGSESQWFFDQGRNCEILRTTGGGWQKGRFRIRLEFIPDNPEAFLQESAQKEDKPESPLDDLRSQLNPE